MDHAVEGSYVELISAVKGPTQEMRQLIGQRDHPHAWFLPSPGQRHDERRDPRPMFSEQLVAWPTSSMPFRVWCPNCSMA